MATFRYGQKIINHAKWRDFHLPFVQIYVFVLIEAFFSNFVDLVAAQDRTKNIALGNYVFNPAVTCFPYRCLHGDVHHAINVI